MRSTSTGRDGKEKVGKRISSSPHDSLQPSSLVNYYNTVKFLVATSSVSKFQLIPVVTSEITLIIWNLL